MAGEFRFDLIPADSSVLCALSGGADSMYLLCRLLEHGCRVHAAHFNHNLRPTAARDEQFVRDWCAARQVPLSVGSGQVAAHAAASGQSIEEAARELRYTFLEQTADEVGCTLIVTGHHAGDNAETVLMNLVRGCGLGGLAGIPRQRGRVLRPMLDVSRREIETYLTAHGIPHVEDESNADPAYTRNRVRHELLPLLEQLNPRAAEHIVDAARRVGEDHAELNRQAELVLDWAEETESGLSLPVRLILSAPRPVALRALKSLAPSASAVHLEALLALCRSENPSARLDLPGATVRRVYEALVFEENPALHPADAPLREGVQTWGGWRITCTPALCPRKAYTDPGCFCLRPGAYLIRPRREGDVLRLGPRPQKTLKKLMIEQRIPRHLRGCVPVLADETGAAAAAGLFGPHREALAQPGEPCLKITIERGE